MGGGGGGGGPVKKIVKKAENIAKVAFNPAGAVAGIAAKKATGSGALANVATFAGAGGDPTKYAVGETAGFAGKTFVDQPKEAKAEAARIENENAEAQRKTMAELKGRQAQEDAEKAAANELEKAKARQRRKADKGRKSTILTDSLGGTGGEMNQDKKSLLGL